MASIPLSSYLRHICQMAVGVIWTYFASSFTIVCGWTWPAVSLLDVLFFALSSHFLQSSEVRVCQFLTKRADVTYDLSYFSSFPEKNVSSSHNATSELMSQYLKLLIKQSTSTPQPGRKDPQVPAESGCQSRIHPVSSRGCPAYRRGNR